MQIELLAKKYVRFSQRNKGDEVYRNGIAVPDPYLLG
jgi:hypothetical protein